MIFIYAASASVQEHAITEAAPRKPRGVSDVVIAWHRSWLAIAPASADDLPGLRRGHQSRPRRAGIRRAAQLAG